MKSPRHLLTGLCAVAASLVVLGAPVTPADPTGEGWHAVRSEHPVSQEAQVRRRAVSARWSTRVVTRGEELVVRGHVPRRHRRAVLQVRRDGRWVVRARTATQGRRYEIVLPARRVGRFTYRTVAPVTRAQRRAGLRRALSLPTTIRVIRPGAAADEGQRAQGLGDPRDFSLITTTRARWNPCETITYRVNADHGPTTALRDVKGAVERVEEATGLDLEYLGPTEVVPRANSGDGYPGDTQIVIAWADRAQSPMLTDDRVAGVGGPIGWHGNVDEAGVPILTWSKGTVVLNSAFNRLEPGFGTGATMGKLVMHELGHVVGLGHAATETQVMYPTLQQEYPTAWGAGDRTGLVGLGAEQGCIVPPSSTSARMYGGGVSVVSELTTDRLADLG